MNTVLDQVIPNQRHKSRLLFDINKAKEEIINFFKKQKPQNARTLVAQNEVNQTEEAVDVMEQEQPSLAPKSEPQNPIIDQYIQEEFFGGQQEKVIQPKPQKEIEQEEDRLGYWKNELQRNCSNIIEGFSKRNIKGRDGENDYIKDARYQLQNIARQARSECIHQVNKRLMKYPKGNIPKDIQKKIKKYKGLENKRRRLEQSCIRGGKKRSVQHLINGNLLKTLINTPENNRFQYQSETSKKIYEVIVLNKNSIQGKGKMIYQLEAIKEGDTELKTPFIFAKTIDHNNEASIFSVSDSTKYLESIEEIHKLITNFIAES